MNENNRVLIDLIKSAAFLVCLDESADSDNLPILEMLHGGYRNAANRWYDCTLQFIINDAGDFGICYEHSVCEGIPVVAMVHDIKKQIQANPTKDKYYFGTSPTETYQFSQNSITLQDIIQQQNNFRIEQNRLGKGLKFQ